MKKYIIGGLGCLFTLSILFRLPLFVEAEDNVLLRPSGNKASVVLETDDMQSEEGKIKDEIVSLQISFQIETKAGDSQKNQVAFDFDKSITSAVKQYRYHKDTGILNVYVAGKEDLCQAEQLSLGSIILNSDQENGTAASVKIVEQSLITVNKAFDKQTSMLGTGTLDAKADLIVGNGGEAPKPPEDDKTEETPPSGGEDSENPPSDGEDNDNNNNNDNNDNNNGNSSENHRPSKGSGSHSSSNSQPAASSVDTTFSNTLKGLLNRRPKTVQGTLSVASDDTEEEEPISEEEDLTETLPEEEPVEEPDEKEDDSFLSDKEEVVEKAVDVGLVAGIVAALVVLILIVLEYRRRWIKHHHKNKK